ncbi:hypothetical protein [Variovorax paradoxus]|jgi:hypothetical protein|uniref:hypothetical protein n=1 Tax=Variovorax paradoxus TaxID=34073 RepID=UPI00155EEBE6
MTGALLFAQFNNDSVDRRSTKTLIEAYQSEVGGSHAELYFFESVPFSASFYSRGTARALANVAEISPGRNNYLVMDADVYKTVSSALSARTTLVTINGGRALLRFKLG